MNPSFLTFAAVVMLLLAGCAGDAQDVPDSSKVKIDVPGVKVDIQKSSGSDPQPDVNVDIQKK